MQITKYDSTKVIIGTFVIHDVNKDAGKMHFLKPDNRGMVSSFWSEVIRKCKDMVLYVSQEVHIKEDDISEDKQGSDVEGWRSKGDSKYDGGVYEWKYI